MTAKSRDDLINTRDMKRAIPLVLRDSENEDNCYDLGKIHGDCLEYIIVHELLHLLEKHHNDNFKALLDKYLPDWRVRKDVLNPIPLSHEEWEY